MSETDQSSTQIFETPLQQIPASDEPENTILTQDEEQKLYQKFQLNLIEKIENLDLLNNLEYLALNNNQIQIVENISHLKKLNSLNLSHNKIKDFDIKQIPNQLEYINFKANLVTQKSAYKLNLVKNLKYLEIIDDEELSTDERFKILGIFPKHLESYQSKLKSFYKKNPDLQPDQNPFSKLSSYQCIKEQLSADVEIHEQDIEHIRKKVDQMEKQHQMTNNSEIIKNKKTKYKLKDGTTDEQAINELRLRTDQIIEKQREKTEQKKMEHYKEMKEMSKVHGEIINTIRQQNIMNKSSTIDQSNNMEAIFDKDMNESLKKSQIMDRSQLQSKQSQKSSVYNSDVLVPKKRDFSDLAKMALDVEDSMTLN